MGNGLIGGLRNEIWQNKGELGNGTRLKRDDLKPHTHILAAGLVRTPYGSNVGPYNRSEAPHHFAFAKRMLYTLVVSLFTQLINLNALLEKLIS